MLNEVYQLSEALKRAGITVAARSTVFKSNRKQAGLRLWIDDAAHIQKIDVMDEEKVGTLCRYEHSNGFSFPTMNIGPLRKPDKSQLGELKKTLKKQDTPQDEKIAAFLNLVEQAPTAFSQRGFSYLTEKLTVIPKNTEPFWTNLSKYEAEYQAIEAVIRALIKRHWEGEAFLAHLEAELVDTIRNQALEDISMAGVLVSLFFDGGCPILWEWSLLKQEPYEYPVTSIKVRDFLNRKLLAHKKRGQPDGVDALTGKEAVVTQRYPVVNLPILGRTILFSSPKGTYCQDRYGLSEGHLFPVDKDKSEDLQNALYFIAKNDRQGKTWNSIPHETGKSADVVVAYVESSNIDTTSLAEMFSQPVDKKGLFEESVKAVIDQLKQFSGRHPHAQLRLFVISKPDRRHSQVLYHAHLRVGDFTECVKNWQKACRNTPPFSLLIPKKKGAGATPEEPKALFPGQALKAFNTLFLRDGTQATSVNTCRLAQIYSLFFIKDKAEGFSNDHADGKDHAEYLLSKALRQWWPLLAHVGLYRHSGRETKINIVNKVFSLQAAALLGMLLYQLKQTNELYMNDTAYNLGRLLAWADKLHELYCIKVRGGSLPNNLIGSALLNSAASHPGSALGRLCERIAPYTGWAKTYKGDDQGLVKDCFNKLTSTREKIDRQHLKQRFTEISKAELLLGYLSNLYPKKDTNPSNS